MRRFLTGRLFRSVVCLILVCCFLILSSPICVHAVLAESTFYLLGIAAISILGLFGVVFSPDNTAQVEAIGQDWSAFMYDRADTDVKVSILQLIFDQITNKVKTSIAPVTPEDKESAVLKAAAWGAFFTETTKQWIERFRSNYSVSTPSINSADSPNFISGTCIPAGTTIYFSPNYYFTFDVDVYYVGFYSDYTRSSGQKEFLFFTYFYSPEKFQTIEPSSSGLQVNFNDTYNWYCHAMQPIQFIYQKKDGTFYDDVYNSVMSFIPGRILVDFDDFTYSAYIDKFFDGDLFVNLNGFYISPSVFLGGVQDALNNGHDIQDIDIPDIEYGNIITEDQTLVEALTQLQTELANGTKTWQEYVDLMTNGNGININIPNGNGTSTKYPINDGGVSSTPVPPTADVGTFMLDLRDFFPFCIPFDLYKFFSLLCAEPEAPVFHWEIRDLSGNVYPIDVDLSSWDGFAAVFRHLQLLVFIIGLAMASRKFIKW